MRRIVWVLLLMFAFAIPWEYSMDLGEPAGNVARIMGLLLMLVAIPAVFHGGRLRTPGATQWVVLAFYLWFCCSYFWTVAPVATLDRMRSYFQEMMIVWLVWEFAESPRDLRSLLRAYVAGSWVLAALTLANFASIDAMIAGQIRFVAQGQDPNDAARFLDLAFPLAAVLFDGESRWPGRLLALGYLPLGLLAVILTASRGGFLAAVTALIGCAILLSRGHRRRAVLGAFALSAVGASLWKLVPYETFARLATISDQAQGGDLNDRVNIWVLGWHAFVQAPILGYGAGAFVSASGLAPIDTAHNTALSILVNGGLCALLLAVGILALAANSISKTHGPLRLALATALLVWIIASLAATSEENRTTWLLFALIALAGRFAMEAPKSLAACFPYGQPRPKSAIAQPVPEPAFAALQLTGFHAEMAFSADSGRAQHSYTHLDLGAPGPLLSGTGDCTRAGQANSENSLDQSCHRWFDELAARRCRWNVDDPNLPAESQDSNARIETQPDYSDTIDSRRSPIRAQVSDEDRTAALVLGILAVLAVGVSVSSARARSEVLRLPER